MDKTVIKIFQDRAGTQSALGAGLENGFQKT